MKGTEPTLLPSDGTPDVDLAAEAFVPLVLAIIRKRREAGEITQRPLRLVTREQASDAPLRDLHPVQ